MRVAVVVLAGLVTLSVPTAGASQPPPPVELSALLDEALGASPELLELRARMEAAATVPDQRGALPDPRLRASYTNDGVSAFTLGDSVMSNLLIGWEQEVPFRKVRERSAAVAAAQVDTLRAASASAEARIRARVLSLYADLWRLDHTQALLEESRALLATAAEAARARYESGDGLQEGMIRAQGALRRVDLESSELALMRHHTALALATTAGRTRDLPLGPALELPEIDMPIDPDEVARIATAASPEVFESAARVREADASLEDARAQQRTEFSWMAAYQYRGGLDPMVMGGFSVRLPVFKDRKQARAVAGAELSRKAAAYGRARAEIDAALRAHSLLAEIAGVDEQLRLYREAIVPQSQAAFESANAAFASGKAGMGLVLEDLDRWVADRKAQLELRARRVRAAAELEALTQRPLLMGNGSRRAQ